MGLGFRMVFTDCDALIFDSDGVLVNSEVINIAVEQEYLAELGLTYDYATYVSRFVGLANADFHAQLAADFNEHVGGEFPQDFGSQLDERIWPDRGRAEAARRRGKTGGCIWRARGGRFFGFNR